MFANFFMVRLKKSNPKFCNFCTITKMNHICFTGVKMSEEAAWGEGTWQLDELRWMLEESEAANDSLRQKLEQKEETIQKLRSSLKQARKDATNGDPEVLIRLMK